MSSETLFEELQPVYLVEARLHSKKKFFFEIVFLCSIDMPFFHDEKQNRRIHFSKIFR